MFIVHNELDDGWMWVTNVRTEEQGLIVEDLVEEVVSSAGEESPYSEGLFPLILIHITIPVLRYRISHVG